MSKQLLIAVVPILTFYGGFWYFTSRPEFKAWSQQPITQMTCGEAAVIVMVFALWVLITNHNKKD